MCHHNRRARRPRRARRERRQGALGMLAAYIIGRYEEKRALQESSKENQTQQQETVLLHGEQSYGRTIPAEQNTYRSEWVEEKGVMGQQVEVTRDGGREEFVGTAPPTYGQAMRER